MISKIKKALITVRETLKNHRSPYFECPVCGYIGPFSDVSPPSGMRKYARCPACDAMERHRLQYLVLESLLQLLPCSSMSMLHFAPEAFFINYFRQCFGHYETADLYMEHVDHKVDLTALPFASASVDFVFASHVLEHIPDDRKAIAEIRRILTPDGIAVLPVPLVGHKTIEYPQPNPAEANHVRAPGYEDYFERYKPFFSRVAFIGSDAFPEKHQLYVYEDRSRYPTDSCPWRLPVLGERHPDQVPVCYC